MNIKSHGGEVKEEIEIFLFFISIVQTCRKTHRKWTGAELIGEVDGKLDCKETMATGWIIIFVKGSILRFWLEKYVNVLKRCNSKYGISKPFAPFPIQKLPHYNDLVRICMPL